MTPNPMTALCALRDALSVVADVATCKIGMESNMTPADYPMVRIVPSLTRYANVISQRQTEVLIYFGKPIHEFETGLEFIYHDLYNMECEIIDAADTSDVYCSYLETIADEDRVDGYKLMAIRMMVNG